MFHSSRAVILSLTGFLVACGGPEPIAISLVEQFFEGAVVEGTVDIDPPEPTEWRFDGEGTIPAPEDNAATFGWTVFNGIEGLRVRDDSLLVGTTGELPLLHATRPEDLDESDMLHAIEIRMKVSEGTRMGISFNGSEEIDTSQVIEGLENTIDWPLGVPLVPGDEFQTYFLSTEARFGPDGEWLGTVSVPISRLRNILVQPSEAEGAEFEIASIRIIPQKEHLLTRETGPGWHGLSEVYRETIVSRSPERVSMEVKIPSNPWLELAVGTIEDGPVTFKVAVGAAPNETNLLRRTVTTPRRWESVRLDMSAYAGLRVTLSLELEADDPGRLGYWGTPVVRRSGSVARTVERAPARRELADRGSKVPQGVIIFLADALRRDHLDPYGYERPTAPVLASLVEDGALFTDNISQATWTKVSVPSILSSLYPSTNGIVGFNDRLSSQATTLAEAFREAGYATFHMASVIFSGRLSNLHQGVEVLHEQSSVSDLDHSGSKTARTYVDRILEWLEDHDDVPFFAFIHVFDPHTPFEPYRPYGTMWADASAKDAHQARLDSLEEFHEEPKPLPDQDELEDAGIDPDVFVAHEADWYDGSIRGMDVEIGRLLEGLETHGLGDKTLLAFISDHGEELLDHGKHFHGNNTYGEMLNVPLILWWPGVIPAGTVVDSTVQSIDLMPTLLELAGVAIPELVQGQSLVPWFARPEEPATLGWVQRPAFSERIRFPSNEEREDWDIDQFSVVHEGWKLIKNFDPPEGRGEYELYNHVTDPLDHENLVDAHPDIVEMLKAKIDEWQEWMTAAKLPPDTLGADAMGLSPEDMARLRSLGYIQ